jgi:RNA polymerase sigma-70 factor (ECF subfamily)
MQLLQQNDEVAFAELYNRYWERMLIQANLLLQSHEDSEEIVQDIFVQLWKRRKTISLIYSFHTYLASILKYECFSLLAKKKARKLSFLQNEVVEKADHSTQQWLDYETLRTSLETAVLQLPEKCQLIFRLSREHGLTDIQIAETLNITHKTVRTQMHRALKKLKIALHQFSNFTFSLLLF